MAYFQKIILGLMRTEFCFRVCPQYDHHYISKLANRFIQKVMAEIPDVVMNGDAEQRYNGEQPGRCVQHATTAWQF